MELIIKRGTEKKAITEIIKKWFEKNKAKKPSNLSKYAGSLMLTKDPAVLQREWRDEWE